MADFEPRRARPGEVFTYTDADSGRQIDMRADDDGVVEPKDAAGAAVLDAYGLSVARKALAEKKAAEPQKDGA